MLPRGWIQQTLPSYFTNHTDSQDSWALYSFGNLLVFSYHTLWIAEDNWTYPPHLQLLEATPPPAAGVWEPAGVFQLQHSPSLIPWAIVWDAAGAAQYSSWDNACTVFCLQLFREKLLTPLIARWKLWNCLFYPQDPCCHLAFTTLNVNKTIGSSEHFLSALFCLTCKGHCAWQGRLGCSCLWLPGFF